MTQISDPCNRQWKTKVKCHITTSPPHYHERFGWLWFNLISVTHCYNTITQISCNKRWMIKVKCHITCINSLHLALLYNNTDLWPSDRRWIVEVKCHIPTSPHHYYERLGWLWMNLISVTLHYRIITKISDSCNKRGSVKVKCHISSSLLYYQSPLTLILPAET